MSVDEKRSSAGSTKVRLDAKKPVIMAMSYRAVSEREREREAGRTFPVFFPDSFLAPLKTEAAPPERSDVANCFASSIWDEYKHGTYDQTPHNGQCLFSIFV